MKAAIRIRRNVPGANGKHRVAHRMKSNAMSNGAIHPISTVVQSQSLSGCPATLSPINACGFVVKTGEKLRKPTPVSGDSAERRNASAWMAKRVFCDGTKNWAVSRPNRIAVLPPFHAKSAMNKRIAPEASKVWRLCFEVSDQ